MMEATIAWKKCKCHFNGARDKEVLALCHKKGKTQSDRQGSLKTRKLMAEGWKEEMWQAAKQQGPWLAAAIELAPADELYFQSA